MPDSLDLGRVVRADPTRRKNCHTASAKPSQVLPPARHEIVLAIDLHRKVEARCQRAVHVGGYRRDPVAIGGQ